MDASADDDALGLSVEQAMLEEGGACVTLCLYLSLPPALSSLSLSL